MCDKILKLLLIIITADFQYQTRNCRKGLFEVQLTLSHSDSKGDKILFELQRDSIKKKEIIRVFFMFLKLTVALNSFELWKDQNSRDSNQREANCIFKMLICVMMKYKLGFQQLKYPSENQARINKCCSHSYVIAMEC